MLSNNMINASFSVSGVNADFTTLQTVGVSVSAGTIVYGDLPSYGGEYTSTPCSTQQVYETANKRMVSDFTVLGIPVYRADNEDGVTVTISES